MKEQINFKLTQKERKVRERENQEKETSTNLNLCIELSFFAKLFIFLLNFIEVGSRLNCLTACFKALGTSLGQL